MSETFDRGMAVRREVLGNAHVDRAEAAKTEFDLPFQTLITESAWGTVWASDRLTRRERSMLTVALLAATGNLLRRSLNREPAYPGLRSLIAQCYQSVKRSTDGPITRDSIIAVATITELVERKLSR